MGDKRHVAFVYTSVFNCQAMGITEETTITEVIDGVDNYVECNDRITFHPGYYVEEILEDSGLAHEDFAK